MSKPTAAKLPAKNLVDWESFQRVCADVLGFPDFYSANMNAWIDCMTSIADPEDAKDNSRERQPPDPNGAPGAEVFEVQRRRRKGRNGTADNADDADKGGAR